jgi:hypothetical protein
MLEKMWYFKSTERKTIVCADIIQGEKIKGWLRRPTPYSQLLERQI